MTTKNSIREEIAALRKGLSAAERGAAEQRLYEKVRPYLQTTRTVLVYSALPYELSLGPIIADLWERGVRVVFPRVVAPHTLALHEVSSRTQLVAGAFSVFEPDETLPEVDPSEVDLALIPGIAFTPAGERLGYGGGYYDTLLPRLSSNCMTIGVCFAFQIFDSLPNESHDQSVKKVISA